MREKTIETRLVREVKKLGGLAYKLISPSAAGLPDRLVLLPGARCAFVELKAPGQHMRPLQVRRAEEISRLGFPVICIDHPTQITPVLEELNGIRTS